MKKNWKRLVLALTMVLGLTLGLVLGLNRLSLVGKADETTTTVELTVTYRQTEARSMLKLINEFRTGDDAWYWNSDNTTKTTCTGLNELVYDYDLEAIAMQRAAETALYWNHYRPDGNSYSAIYKEDDYYYLYFYVGENIAAGRGSAIATAEYVFELWQETDETYSGQGHRRNMLSTNFTSVGIGCVYYNGYYYWVQAFATPQTEKPNIETTANDSKTTVSIVVKNSLVTSATLTADPVSYSLTCGDSEGLPTLTASLIMKETYPSTIARYVTVVSPSWSSKDTSVATVANGSVTADTAGTTDLTVSALGTSTTVSVEVSHDYEAVVTEPTCTEGGYTTYTCSGCDDTYTADETEATGHSWGEGTVTKAATCTESGIMTYTCTVCGDTYTEEIAATGHTYGNPEFTWYADYSAEAAFNCEVCGQKVVETAAVTSDTTDATCTEDGATIYTASLTFDGVTYTDKQTVTIAAAGHDYDDGVVTTEATCTEDGVMTYTCSKCGDTYTETIAATGHDYEAVVTEPTCTENGYTTYTCSKCGDSYTADETDATGHSYDDGAVTTEATCTEAGERTYTCTACGDTYTETIAATGHRYIEDVLVKAPTCTEVGVKTTTCIICGDVYTTTLAALGHRYDDGVVTTEATCTEAGEKTYTCASCGDTYTETIPATGHSYVPAVTDPTCTEKGYTTYTCTACGDSYTADETDALGHTWDDGVITKEATEEENGVRTYTCTVCGETKTETIPAITHNFGDPVFTWAEDYNTATATFTCVDEGCGRIIEEAAEVTTATTNPTCTEAGERVYTATVTFNGNIYTDTKAVMLAATGHSYEAIVTAPTCTEKGYTTYTCTVCGDTYTANETDALGHSYDEGAVTTAATCTEDGERTYTCTVCGDSYTEVIPATGHSYDEGTVTTAATCTEAGERTYTCTVCGDSYTEVIPATGHSYDEGVVTKAATCTEAGERTYTCTVCGDSYTEVIPATGHSYDEGVVTTAATCTEDGERTYTCTVCGDTYTEAIAATGHTPMDEGTVTKEATCTEEGKIAYTCAVCGETYTEVISVIDHTYETVVTVPTCTEKGYTTYTCTACGDSYTADETEALGHTWDSGVVTKAATETEDGVMTYTCTVCGETSTESIPATGSTEDNTGDGNTEDEDTTENNTTEDNTAEADTTEGTATETTTEAASEPVAIESAVTGDDSPAEAMAVTLLLAAVGIAALTLMKKRTAC